MATLEEAVNKVRAEFCTGCNEMFSEREILAGARCPGCERAAEVGRKFAHLRD